VADLKGTLEFFMRELFGADTAVEFRPHFFPFTEPSLEVYVKSKALKGGERWIEVAGSGVVHPAVFEQVNKARGDKAYDPEKWSGFAFGLGMDRLAMILFDIPTSACSRKTICGFYGNSRNELDQQTKRVIPSAARNLT